MDKKSFQTKVEDRGILMGHLYNIKAFKLAFTLNGQGSLLLSIYSKLVCIELALKDNQQQNTTIWPALSHNVSGLLNNIALNSLGIRFNNALKKIKCTDRNGNNLQSINERNYPALRYMNHDSDISGGSSDSDLTELDIIVDDIIIQMRNKGVFI
ncbi:MAG: hypothetical protein SFU98_13825 [Leptospiraceae bacterium]|nr:hypothetical protein [Leptospiraceae bacterium]